ncbi:uncharacterized protein LOC114188903 [Vigna unguiculata]|uniref:uncharacterized protein LOC114188903 n=1 Tax=Vigna unguiculata TaxID=3917 RepID=UPI0010170931|nr:uncharacterized protein LOC114188903 [Vigna unguiculata]
MEVVKKEVTKLLQAGIIYPISDCTWVSLVHVVPKKSGITVVKNEKNKLILTRVLNSWRVCIDYRKSTDSSGSHNHHCEDETTPDFALHLVGEEDPTRKRTSCRQPCSYQGKRV